MKKRRTALLLALALAVSLAACAHRQQDPGTVLWFAGDVSDWDKTSAALGSVPYAGAATPEAMALALLAGPGEVGLRSPFPAGTSLLGCKTERGLLRVDLSGQYGELTGYALTLANCCLTLTLTQIQGVDRLQIEVEGRPIGEELRAGQVLLSGAEERPVEVSADLYFPRAAGRGLGVEARVFQLTVGDVLAEEVMRALLSGPADQGFSTVIPEGTELRSVHLEDGICYVDLTQALLDGLPEGEDAQNLLVYSIVNTLGNLNTVSAVCLLVEGKPLSRLGQVDLSEPLEPDFGLVGA